VTGPNDFTYFKLLISMFIYSTYKFTAVDSATLQISQSIDWINCFSSDPVTFVQLLVIS
jgi:hypothetical protein